MILFFFELNVTHLQLLCDLYRNNWDKKKTDTQNQFEEMAIINFY